MQSGFSKRKQTSAYITRTKSTHELTYNSVVASEQEFRLSLESLNDITDHSERFLARKSIGFSPIEMYNQKLSGITTPIYKSNLMIEHLTKRLEDLIKRNQEPFLN